MTPEKEKKLARQGAAEFWDYWVEYDSEFIDKIVDLQSDVVKLVLDRVCAALGIDSGGIMGQNIHEMLVEQILGSEYIALQNVSEEMRLGYVLTSAARCMTRAARKKTENK